MLFRQPSFKNDDEMLSDEKWDDSSSSNLNLAPSNMEKSSWKTNSEKCKKRNQKNSYSRILDQLPQEIKDKLDKSKENVEDMWKTLTLPKDYKPSRVIKWMKKVSQNELKLIYDEIFKIRVTERKLKREEQLSFESEEDKDISSNSQQSKTISKDDSERYVSVGSRDTPNRIINFNANITEGNSACSKTSSNSKAGQNLVRIPLEPEKKTSRKKTDQNVVPIYLKYEPKIVSIEPGKRIVLKFENPETLHKVDEEGLKCRRNILKYQKSKDIAVEDDLKIMNKDNAISLLSNDIEKSINAFSSVCWQDEPELNFDSHCEDDNYMREDENFGYIVQPHIPQIIESVDGCSDLYIHRPMLFDNIDPTKGYNFGNQLHILNQFWNNITPIFSMTEEHAEQLRPNVLEIKGVHKDIQDFPSNLPDFPCGLEDAIMLSEEFKFPIETHNH